MCKCQVDSGAGSILPTETGFFSYKQQHENWRLACQVKVKENIEMHIPEAVLGIKKWECDRGFQPKHLYFPERIRCKIAGR